MHQSVRAVTHHGCAFPASPGLCSVDSQWGEFRPEGWQRGQEIPLPFNATQPLLSSNIRNTSPRSSLSLSAFTEIQTAVLFSLLGRRGVCGALHTRIVVDLLSLLFCARTATPPPSERLSIDPCVVIWLFCNLIIFYVSEKWSRPVCFLQQLLPMEASGPRVSLNAPSHPGRTLPLVGLCLSLLLHFVETFL